MTISARLSVYAGLSLLILVPNPARSQVPTRASEPRLVVPTDRATPPPGQPTIATPEAAAPEAAAPAPVAAPAPTGVTSLPAPSTPPTTSSSSQAATMAEKRSYVIARSALVVDGQNLPVRSLEGGTMAGEVVAEKTTEGLSPKKHIGGIKVEEISITAGLDSKPLTDWIAASWKGSGRKSGTIMLMDHDYRVVGQRDFTDAVITKTVMPALDASTRDPAQVTLTLLPQAIRTVSPGGAAPSGSYANKTQKAWTSQSFRFEMDGLDGTRVTRVSPVTVVQSVVENPVGELRDYQKEPGKIEFENLKVTFSTSTADSWTRWHDDFVVKGNNADDQEKNGAIVYLSASTKEELGRVNLFHCGIIRVSPDKADARSETISRMTAELYCERMELVASAAK